jgi:ribA/ribD-fused uncharacterized protein
MDSYNSKYKKYKTKYLELKNVQSGGIKILEKNTVIHIIEGKCIIGDNDNDYYVGKREYYDPRDPREGYDYYEVVDDMVSKQLTDSEFGKMEVDGLENSAKLNIIYCNKISDNVGLHSSAPPKLPKLPITPNQQIAQIDNPYIFDNIIGFFKPNPDNIATKKLIAADVFGNFYKSDGQIRLVRDGVTYTYNNAEAAFQSAKAAFHINRAFNKNTHYNQFQWYDGEEAFSNKIKLDSLNKTNWFADNEGIMFDILLAKFKQNDNLKQLLLNTRNKYILEHGERIIDEVWSDARFGTGMNKLGKTLMRVRAMINKQSLTITDGGIPTSANLAFHTINGKPYSIKIINTTYRLCSSCNKYERKQIQVGNVFTGVRLGKCCKICNGTTHCGYHKDFITNVVTDPLQKPCYV